jgi:hypothetical protein
MNVVHLQWEQQCIVIKLLNYIFNIHTSGDHAVMGNSDMLTQDFSSISFHAQDIT